MKQLNIAMESIAFQTGAFFKELTLIAQDMLAAKANSSETFAPFGTRMEQCIYKHTGINVSLRAYAGGDQALVLIPGLTKGHVLNSREFGKFLAKNFDADKMSFYNLEKKGWIDPAASRVGGAFSEIVFRMFLGHYFVEGRNMDAEETAATILHEVGHAFTFLQFLADTVITNIVLQRTYQELTNGDADKKVKMILTKAADDMQIKNRDWLQAVEDTTSKDVAIKILASAVAIEERAVDNKRFFSMNSCEELADIFAARHGAGRAIISARAKWGRDRRNLNFGIMAGCGWALAGLAVAALSVAVAAPAGLLLGLVFGAVGGHDIGVGAKAAASMPDITGFRREAQKIRNQYVEQLKQSDLPKEDIAAAIENIEIVDQMIANYQTNDVDQATVVQFFDMFRRGKMEARASREYTDRLEQLAANDLFIRAAQFGAKA